jgi:hypothetical protein
MQADYDEAHDVLCSLTRKLNDLVCNTNGISFVVAQIQDKQSALAFDRYIIFKFDL